MAELADAHGLGPCPFRVWVQLPPAAKAKQIGDTMKIDVFEKKGCSVEIKVDIPVEEVKNEMESVFTDIQKNAAVDGFRKGHAPMEFVKREFARTAVENTIHNLMTSSILVAFGLLMAMIFLEITGTKASGEHIFAKHPKFFGAAIIILAILIFTGSGGLTFLNIPLIAVSDGSVAIIFFLIVMVASIWILIKEGDKK